MADTWADLRTELSARGYDYLETSRLNRYINRGAAMLYDEYPWPFLESEATGDAPLTISDLGQVLSVVDSTTGDELTMEDGRFITNVDPDANDTGNPTSWYARNGIINVYPNTAASLTVRYIAAPPDFTSDTDEPLVPQQYRNLITDAAVYLALKDNDEFGAANEAKALYDAEVAQMRSRLSISSLQGGMSVVLTGGIEDYG